MKKMSKVVLSLIVFLGMLVGCTSNKPSDNATSERGNYNGVYSLTRIDEKGNDTWDGWLLYVQNDKLITGVLYESATSEELKKLYPDAPEDELTRYFMRDNVEYIESSAERERQKVKNVCFTCPYNSLTSTIDDSICYTAKGMFNFSEITVSQENFDKLITNVVVKSINDLGLEKGYEENSQEIWLSKLLSDSIYKDYKLIQYNDSYDFEINCLMGDEYTFEELNKLYQANLTIHEHIYDENGKCINE